MLSLLSITANTPRSCCRAVVEIHRIVGRSLPFGVLQYRSHTEDGLDGLVPPSPESSPAAHPVMATPLSGVLPRTVPKTQTLGADRQVRDRNAPIKGLGFSAGVPFANLKPTVAGLKDEDCPVGNPVHASSIVTGTRPYHASPRQGFVRGEQLCISSASGESHAQLSEAIAKLKHCQEQGIAINSYTFVEVLKRCSIQKDLGAARQVHDCIIQSKMDKNPYVVNTLLNSYVRCGRLQDARRLFDELEKKTVFTWSIMIAGYAKNDHTEDALEICRQMRQGDVQPNELIYLTVLKACATSSALHWGKEVHEYVRHAGLESDARVGTALIQMYAQCGCITKARGAFGKLINRDMITWNVMVGAYAKSGLGEEGYRLFQQMQREGFKPDAITYMNILNASASIGALEWVKRVHRDAIKAGLESDLRVGNALIHMYAKCGRIDHAHVIFNRLKTRDVTTWNTMIGAFAETGSGVEAYQQYLLMKQLGFPRDAVTYLSILNASGSAGDLEWVKEVHGDACRSSLESDLRVGSALVQAYAKAGSLRDARQIFDRLTARDVMTWTIMIGAHAESGSGVEAYQLFRQMKREGFQPGAYTYASILNVSASAGALEWVKEVHRDAQKAGLESDLRVGNALIHMYAKCGSIDDARQTFNRMERRNLVAWNVMIGGLAQHGCGDEAVELFGKMAGEGVKPDETSFAAVLSACCHSGLVDDSQRLFSAMRHNHGISPTIVHYTCMVDLLGRAGQLQEAKLLIESMPVDPNAITWRALLGACRTYGNVELGELAAEEVLKLDPKDAAAYVLLSNMYATAGQWEKVSSVRAMMEKSGVCKEPGRSWIEVDGEIHEFVAGDTSHPEASKIYTALQKLTDELKAEGYIPDTKLVMQDIREEDKELALCSHSEKLAIAYGLMCIAPGKPIRIFKNLRVCSDCHTATKLISKVTGREVIARDSNRFHHFRDGVCSCGDYW